MKGKLAYSRFLQVNLLKVFLTDKRYTNRFLCIEMWNNSSKPKPEKPRLNYSNDMLRPVEGQTSKSTWNVEPLHPLPKSERSMPCSKLATGHTWYFVTATFLFSANLRLNFLRGLFRSDSQAEIFYTFILSPVNTIKQPNAIINNDGRLKDLILLFKIPMGTQKDFSEIYRQVHLVPKVDTEWSYTLKQEWGSKEAVVRIPYCRGLPESVGAL